MVLLLWAECKDKSRRYPLIPQSKLERQVLIDKALRDSSAHLTKAELRKVLVVAGLTPAEYENLGYKEK
jgi:hypothetical protein